MTQKQIIEVARSITNGKQVVLKYERPVKVLKRKTDRQFTKLSIIEFVYDDRDWFQQFREENGLNKQPEREQIYEKIQGCLYRHLEKGDLYFRCAIPESKVQVTVLAFEGTKEVSLYPKGHKNSKGKESVYDLLQAGEKPDYTCNDIQSSLQTSTGMVDERIRQLNYLVDRIYSLEVE
jgi:hypothetical protein